MLAETCAQVRVRHHLRKVCDDRRGLGLEGGALGRVQFFGFEPQRLDRALGIVDRVTDGLDVLHVYLSFGEIPRRARAETVGHAAQDARHVALVHPVQQVGEVLVVLGEAHHLCLRDG